MTTHPQTAPSPVEESLVSQLRAAVVGYPIEECDPPSADAVARAAEFLVRLERERPDLVEGMWIGVGRDGSIEIDISLPKSIVALLVRSEDGDRISTVIERRATGAIEHERLSSYEVMQRLESPAD